MRMEMDGAGVGMGGAIRSEVNSGVVIGLMAATVLATFLGVALLTFAGERLAGMDGAIWGAERFKPVFSGLLTS